MSQTLLALFLSSMVGTVYASQLQSSIGMIDEGAEGEETLVMANHEGRVFKADKDDLALIDDLKKLAMTQEEVLLEINEQDEVIGFTYLPNENVKPEDSFSDEKMQEFTPTNLASMEEAKNLFKNMNTNTKRRSQCFNRAHIWTFDWFSRFGVSTQKVFLFFTSRYIRRESYRWWFHVSPFVLVNSQEWVMDREFTNEPLEMKDWTDIYISSHANCPSVRQYSQYRQNQSAHDCYLIKVPMYYWEPNDLEALEARGTAKNNWIQNELEIARAQAFRD